MTKNCFSRIIFLWMIKCNRSSILLCLLFFTLLVPGFSQQKVLIGSVTDLYQSLELSNSNARIAQSSKTLKVKENELVNIVIDNHSKIKEGDLFVGKVVSSKSSHVYFTFNNGEVNGKVLMPEQKRAYIYTSHEGNVSVAPEDINKVLCIEYQEANTASSPLVSALAPPPGSSVYTLQSLPGATAVVMLDFDGHDASGSWWGNIVAEPTNSTEEEITGAWNLISEDFRAYQLNITTSEAIYQAAPANQRMRVIFTPTTTAAPGSGGVAFIGTFTTGGELAPCWVFNVANYGDGGKILGETASHEIGHTVGLLHDGRELPEGHEEYYAGQGVWAPIMGVGYYREVTHWSKGEYQYANNFEDDVAIIAANNGFGYRVDSHGNTNATASPLIISGGVVSGDLNKGVILTQDDQDVFSFTAIAGFINIEVAPAPLFPNLDVYAELYSSSGELLRASNPDGLQSAVISYYLTPDTYYLRIEGVNGLDYSDYSSIGAYSISGTIPTDNNNPDDSTSVCNDYIQQLSNDDIKFSVTYPVQKAYVEIFARKNDQQHLATNILASQVNNADGTFTYSYVMPASFYLTGDKIDARFYSYSSGGAGIFTPGPSEGVWSEIFFYNQTDCVVNPPNSCGDLIQQLSNGDIEFLVTFPVQKAYVEVFAQKNGQQNIATNIVGSQISNSNGTFSYKYIVPASFYNFGDVLLARFYSYSAGGPGIFTPGPAEGNWSQPFIYNESVCSGNSFSTNKEGYNVSEINIINTSLIFYPNPAQAGSELIIEKQNQDDSELSVIRILDLSGHIVSLQNISMNGGQAVLNLSGINPGIYVLDAGISCKQKLVIE